MTNYDPRGELATRDVVARSIYNEIREGRGTPRGGVYLDVTHLPAELIEEKLETMLFQFLDVGLDIRKEPMEVAPTAHHVMGGSLITPKCETTVANLYAAGEAAGGVHGANRLGGNALAETQVFGLIAGESAAKNAIKAPAAVRKEQLGAEEDRLSGLFKEGEYYPHQLKEELQALMWDKVAIIRNQTGLKTAFDQIQSLKARMDSLTVPDGKGFNRYLQDALELENMLLVAELVTQSAIIRKESRGSHYREDYPETLKEWNKSIVLNKKESVRFIER